MKMVFGAVAGALALGAVLVSYDLGERRAFNREMAPITEMAIGPDGMARPYAVLAGQTAFGQTPYAVAPYGGYSVPPRYVNDRVATAQPTAQRISSQRAVVAERGAAPRRSWQKSALLIGGSAGAGAGIGALIGGKKGALAGAAIGGGSAAIYDQMKRH